MRPIIRGRKCEESRETASTWKVVTLYIYIYGMVQYTISTFSGLFPFSDDDYRRHDEMKPIIRVRKYDESAVDAVGKIKRRRIVSCRCQSTSSAVPFDVLTLEIA